MLLAIGGFIWLVMSKEKGYPPLCSVSVCPMVDRFPLSHQKTLLSISFSVVHINQAIFQSMLKNYIENFLLFHIYVYV